MFLTPTIYKSLGGFGKQIHGVRTSCHLLALRLECLQHERHEMGLYCTIQCTCCYENDHID